MDAFLVKYSYLFFIRTPLIIVLLTALDMTAPGILLVDLSQYIVTVVTVLLVVLSFQPSQNHIRSITDDNEHLRAGLRSYEAQIQELDATYQELQTCHTNTLAQQRTEQADYQTLVQRHQLLETNYADTLTTLELRDSQLADVRNQCHDLQTHITVLTDQGDELREAAARSNRKFQRVQAALRNLRDNFPGAAEALMSIPHPIENMVLTKEGRPDRRYNAGKPFCQFRRETTTVLCNGKRTYLLLTTVSE